MVMQAAAMYPSTQAEQHLFFASAAFFWVLKCPVSAGVSDSMCDDLAASAYFQDAIDMWNMPLVHNRCTYLVPNWDNVCFDGALMMVQATGQVDSIFTHHLERMVSSWISPAVEDDLMCLPTRHHLWQPCEWITLSVNV
jgi:hypothetical protein